MKSAIMLAGIFTSLLSVSCTSTAQVTNSYTRQIDSLVQAQQPRAFNGVVLVTQYGKTLYTKAYGYADFHKKTPLRVADRFSTMSIAKQVTAALILREVEKGTINLHVPVRKYLPGLKYTWADTVTVHQLLNNTSGLEAFDMDKPLKFTPGKAFSYSNTGYSLAGQVLEKQSGKSYRQLVTDLFKKCGMSASAYYTPQNESLLTKGHTIAKDGKVVLWERINFKPADYFGSHLMVTAADLAKWNEQLHTGKILQPATYQLMTQYTITATHSLFGNTPIGYGYGLRINDKAPFKEIGHTGFHPAEGFTAVNLYYPEKGISVIVLENQASENFDIAYHFEQEVRNIVINNLVLPGNNKAAIHDLKTRMQQLLAGKQLTAGIAVKAFEEADTMSINGHMLMPMMSVFKFHIALAVLDQVDKNKLKLDQEIFVKKEELLPDTWSPMREEYPDGNRYLTLDQLIRYTVSHSDNNGCDILLRLVGGPQVVEKFIHQQGIKELTIKVNEQEMQSWENLYINTTTPVATTTLLEKFYQGKILQPATTAYLYQVMVATSRGLTWMKAGLPEGTELAHRTGISNTNEQQVRAALNDIGIIKLPNGKRIGLAVYLKNISEERATTEKLVADITRATWDHFTGK